ncbi:transcription elongation factor GreB [Paraphotobacterium marinum]|uniref:Transcription elongation factor GreB n=1 Tax=Paraphotobacterium marinum TaxID=1755811 RepID=A0A220VFD0_9GAMM|nr:transcription elongation factor GreB [Paraphotobacterium marinum]ASK79118.1 transcription elongation factor GreB [Paraphotobacterium marinum]
MRTPLITPEGYKQLQDELSNLLNKERPKTVEKVSWAASLGDRSENSDYIENKRKLRFLDRRIRYLSKRIPQLKIIKPSKQQDGKVFFGAFVDVENSSGLLKSFQIVGYDEIFDRDELKVSIDAPMARALLGKEEGDDVSLKIGNFDRENWTIIKIMYKF